MILDNVDNLILNFQITNLLVDILLFIEIPSRPGIPHNKYLILQTLRGKMKEKQKPFLFFIYFLTD